MRRGHDSQWLNSNDLQTPYYLAPTIELLLIRLMQLRDQCPRNSSAVWLFAAGP